MATLTSILDFTKSNPTAYLGRGSGDYYARLTGFVIGYTYGARQISGDSSLHLMPDGFNDFVREALNSRHESPKYGTDDHWTEAILAEAGNDSAAFKLFYEIWESFSKTHAA
jgi:hypothetical protein